LQFFALRLQGVHKMDTDMHEKGFQVDL
jgi:hypothetical protein